MTKEKKGIRLNGYLPGIMDKRLARCIDYAWKSGWLKRKNRYMFVSWAVERIIASIEEEMSQNPRFTPLEDSQT